MSARRTLAASAAALAALVAPGFAALPELPAPVARVLYARPFTLDAPFAYAWSAERQPVTQGWMLVLEAEPELLRPRETQEPVLFVGGIPAARVSRAWTSGRVVAFVPGPIDLADAPVFFGSAALLPEEVGAAAGAAERGEALARGIRPLGRAALARVRGAEEEPARLADRGALLSALYALVVEYVEPATPSDRESP